MQHSERFQDARLLYVTNPAKAWMPYDIRTKAINRKEMNRYCEWLVRQGLRFEVRIHKGVLLVKSELTT